MRAGASTTILRRLAGVAAATGLALTGLTVAAAPASAAACSGTSGVTVVVDTGGSISTRCASGDPSSAWKALTAAGFGTTPVQTFPGALCQINGYPETSCVRMPPASAYWAFFHAKAGGSWTYSSSGISSYNPAPGTVVGFKFGSGGQPGIAPPAPKATSKPKPTTAKPKPTTSAPKATTSAPKSTPKPTSKTAATSHTTSSTGKATSAAKTSGATSTAKAPSASPSATASATASPTASGAVSATPSDSASASTDTSATTLAAQASSDTDDGSSGLGTLLGGAALVALVGGGAGWAAWRRRV